MEVCSTGARRNGLSGQTTTKTRPHPHPQFYNTFHGWGMKIDSYKPNA